MTMNKSVIEEVELENGISFYIQLTSSNKRASISFDGNDTSYGIWLKSDELDKIVEAINKAKEQHNENN